MANKDGKKSKSVVLKPVTDTSAESLISQAITNNVPVETLERLLAMRTQIKAERAKEAFYAAMAEFQAHCPTIDKTKAVKTRTGIIAYRYAPIESIVGQVKSLIQQCGFSYSFRQELKESGVKVMCIITHEMGHTEEYSMEVPFGTKTEIMSHSQVTAAATTFAKRYVFCNAFGIMTGDEDTDGADFKEKDTYDRTPIRPKSIPKAIYDDPDEAPPVIIPDEEKAAPTFTIPADVQEQRTLIFMILRKRGIDVTDAKACKVFVADKTQLELVEANYRAIIRELH